MQQIFLEANSLPGEDSIISRNIASCSVCLIEALMVINTTAAIIEFKQIC